MICQYACVTGDVVHTCTNYCDVGDFYCALHKHLIQHIERMEQDPAFKFREPKKGKKP